MLESPARADEVRVPGEPGIWVLVFGDLTMFALFFCSFLFYRSEDPALYRAAQIVLSQPLGLLNTVILLTSSWLLVLGVQASRQRRQRRASTLIAATFACGLGFALVKYVEYGDRLRAGVTPATNDFYMFYFALTGIHLLHVLVGLGVLTWMWMRVRGPAGPGDPALLDCGAIFWHMVDLLWVMLFALLYLLR
jgi:nitric oxide reductase NorE protein